MEMIDKSGHPPSQSDIQEARKAVLNTIIKNMMNTPPELAVQLPNILRCLDELARLTPKT